MEQSGQSDLNSPKPASRIHHQAMPPQAFTALHPLIQPDADSAAHGFEDGVSVCALHKWIMALNRWRFTESEKDFEYWPGTGSMLTSSTVTHDVPASHVRSESGSPTWLRRRRLWPLRPGGCSAAPCQRPEPVRRLRAQGGYYRSLSSCPRLPSKRLDGISRPAYFFSAAFSPPSVSSRPQRCRFAHRLGLAFWLRGSPRLH